MSDRIPFSSNPDNPDWHLKPQASYPLHPSPNNSPQQSPGYQYPDGMPPQPFPPVQQPYPSVQQPPAPQPYYVSALQPQQQGAPNQTYVVVNTSQKVNTGCGPWVWIVLTVLVVLLVGCVGIPIVMGGVGAYMASRQMTTRVGTPIVGTQHNKMNVPVDVRWVLGYTSHHEKITVTTVNAVTQQEEPGKKDIVINLETTNIDGDSDYASSSRFTLTDDTGQQCKSDFLTAFPQYSGNLSVGSKVSGAIVFQIPPDNRAFLLTFNPVGEGEKGPLYSWDLHL